MLPAFDFDALSVRFLALDLALLAAPVIDFLNLLNLVIVKVIILLVIFRLTLS